jgi:NAD(P)-dependent dehydrogenase (short-subunit alcohol dehydrogenase family)
MTMSKICLVTGASSGIGLATALERRRESMVGDVLLADPAADIAPTTVDDWLANMGGEHQLRGPHRPDGADLSGHRGRS